MQCVVCRTVAPEGSVFCARCGSRVEPGDVGVNDATRLPTPSGAKGTGEAAWAPTSLGGAPGPSGTPSPLAPGTPFGERYRILRRLGEGGMGVVYQAWDGELGVAVALKVIRPDVAADASRAADMERRFKRELLTARQVTHKHVVRIHDLGDVGGVRYLTMPFIEGQDLAHVIAAEGTLSVARVLRLGLQIAEGLSAAHEAGVVHRDLKPENIMLDGDDNAVIMDFGLARTGGGAALTATGAVLGTIGYMAPEQARGETVDARADLYALGLVLYDALAGRVRFGRHPDAMSELLARLQEPPPPLTEVAPRVPAALATAIMRTLAPHRDGRPGSARALADDLQALDGEGHARVPTVAPPPAPAPTVGVAPAPATAPTPSEVLASSPPPRRVVARFAIPAVVAAAVAIGAFVLWRPGTELPSPSPSAATAPRAPVSVLIANFENRTGEAVFDGTLEQALALGVEGASFITAFPRRDAERAAQQIRPGAVLDATMARLVCRREGVTTALVGTIAADGKAFDVTVRVIDPGPGTELARVTERAADKAQVLAAVAALAAKVRTALGDVTPASALAASSPAFTETFTAASLEAAKDYAEGQALANASRDEEAIVLFERATQKDPQMGRAFSGLAASLYKLGRREEADRHYQKALALVDRMTDREKFRTLGSYYLNIAGNYETAIENYTTLLSKYPADGPGHNNLALAYFHTLQFDKALDEGRTLLAIYPKSALYRYNQALYAMYAGDFSTANSEGQQALAINPDLPKAHLAIAMAALTDGDGDAARAAYGRARSTGGARGASLASIGLADVLLSEGDARGAEVLLVDGLAADELNKNRPAAAAKAVALAEARWSMGARPAALAALDHAQQLSVDASVLVPAARLLVAMGRSQDAERLAVRLDTGVSPRTKAYARLVRATIALERGATGAVEALTLLAEAQKLADVWLVRVAKGIAHVQRGAFAEALAELETAGRRRGEATAVFLDDVPSFRYTVPLGYWLGRASEGLGATEAARRHYAEFVRAKGASPASLLQDAGTRLQTLSK